MFCIAKKNELPSGKYEPLILYENDEFYYLPRYIRKYYPHDSIKYFIDNTFTPSEIEPYDFTSTLRDEQVEILKEVIAVYDHLNHIDGIIHARPGTGKTVMSIWFANYLNKKTLIVIDTGKIMEQWRDEIIAHTNLTEDDIGWIKGNKFDVEGKKFIITTPQTLASKVKTDIRSNYIKFRALGIDLVIWDEAHKMGIKYASASLLFNTRNVLGLSATPYNPKERDVLVKSMFNEVIVRYGEYDFQPTIKFVKYNSGLGDQYGKRINWLWNNQFIQGRSIYNSKLHESKTWIDTICNITKREVEDDKRIIIICMTKQQLTFICKSLKDIGVNATKLYSEENDIDKTKDNVIVATYKYASHAFDYKELSRLILAVPLMGKKSLIQTIGRVVRRSDGKIDAIVYDLIDIDEKFNGIFIESIKNKINILNNEFDECKFITE